MIRALNFGFQAFGGGHTLECTPGQFVFKAHRLRVLSGSWGLKDQSSSETSGPARQKTVTIQPDSEPSKPDRFPAVRMVLSAQGLSNPVNVSRLFRAVNCVHSGQPLQVPELASERRATLSEWLLQIVRHGVPLNGLGSWNRAFSPEKSEGRLLTEYRLNAWKVLKTDLSNVLLGSYSSVDDQCWVLPRIYAGGLIQRDDGSLAGPWDFQDISRLMPWACQNRVCKGR